MPLFLCVVKGQRDSIFYSADVSTENWESVHVVPNGFTFQAEAGPLTLSVFISHPTKGLVLMA